MGRAGVYEKFQLSMLLAPENYLKPNNNAYFSLCNLVRSGQSRTQTLHVLLRRLRQWRTYVHLHRVPFFQALDSRFLAG